MRFQDFFREGIIQSLGTLQAFKITIARLVSMLNDLHSKLDLS